MDGTRYNPALLELLGKTPGNAALRALTWAMECGQGGLQAAVLRHLLGRADEEIRRHVAAMLPALHEEARKMLGDEPSLLEPVARVGFSSEDPAVRLGVLELLGEACQPALAYLLASGVNDATEPARKTAGQGLCQVVRRFAHDAEIVAAHLRPSVSAAMSTFRVHQAPEVLQAVILLGFQCPAEVFEQLNDPVNHMVPRLSAAVKALEVAETAPFVLSCLQYETLSHAGRALIARCDWPALGQIGRHEHWLSLKGVAGALKGIRNLRAVAEDPNGLTELPSDLQAGALRLAMACGIARKLKDMLLALALSGEATLAQAALPIVFAERGDSPQLLLMALHSRNAQVQSVAAAKIMSDGADTQLMHHLMDVMPSLEEPVRTLVSQFLGAGGFERYWQNYKRLDQDLRQRAGAALQKLDVHLVDHLAGRLVGRDVSDQLQAVQMVWQLRLVDRFGDTLCQLARYANRTVRAAAVMALRDLKSFDARSTLARCLHDEDDRVQANAIEALAAQGGDASIVLDKIDSPHCRTRANTIKWLLQARHGRGPKAMSSMLTDPRSAHRLSALWVVKVLRYAPAMPLLEQMSLRDAEAKVRARAAGIRRLLAIDQKQEVHT
jgi:hypothetical protein